MDANGIRLANLYEDNVKVSTIENESESAEARGGQGNGRLMSWDYGRNATLTMQDALLSDLSLSLLAGTALKKGNVDVVGREVLTAVTTTGDETKVTLAEEAKTGSVTVYKVSKGVMGEEITAFTVNAKEVTFANAGGTPDAEADSQVMVFYTYSATEATQVTFSADKFPATYKVVGDTVVLGEDGINRKMQFVIPKAKLQSSFSLTMDAENVSTFDFTLDVLVDAETKDLYKIIRL